MEFVVSGTCGENRVDCTDQACNRFAGSTECVYAVSYKQKSQSHMDYLVVTIVHFRFKFLAQNSHHSEALDIATTRHYHAQS